MYESIYQMIASGNTQTAQSLLDRILESNPDDSNSLALSGMAQWYKGDPLKGENLFKQSLNIDPNNPSNLLIYAHCLMRALRDGEAIRMLEMAYGIDPNFSNIAEQLAIANHNKGILSDALKWSKIAAATDPTGRNIASLGFFLSLTGKCDDGESAVHEALKRDPNNATVHCYCGMFWIIRGNIALARRHFKTGYQSRPTSLNSARYSDKFFRRIRFPRPCVDGSYNTMGF